MTDTLPPGAADTGSAGRPGRGAGEPVALPVAPPNRLLRCLLRGEADRPRCNRPLMELIQRGSRTTG